MKKCMFAFLCAISFCKGADTPYSWTQAIETKYPHLASFPNLKRETLQIDLSEHNITAIPEGLKFPRLQKLNLNNNQITSIPESLKFPKLQELYLKDNQINSILPQILKQFPALQYINVSNNPLPRTDVDKLSAAAVAVGRKLNIIARCIASNHTGVGLKLLNKNPANLTMIQMNLNTNDTFTNKTLKNLVDESERWDESFVLEFSQDDTGTWHTAVFHSPSYKKHIATQVLDPLNHQQIRHTVPFTVVKIDNNHYEAQEKTKF